MTALSQIAGVALDGFDSLGRSGCSGKSSAIDAQGGIVSQKFTGVGGGHIRRNG